MQVSEKTLVTRSTNLATWSVHHPIGVIMIAIALMVIGGISVDRLGIDLLPHIIYPEVRIRVIDSGVPAKIMEDQVTRQLEEQLAITEDAISVQSSTTEGRSSVDLTFNYGKDIDIAFRDASTRLDRAKRFLPATIDPPIIYKLDPSQIPVLEYVISSTLLDPVALRSWVDNVFAKWFVTLPGVAASEIGGGLVREIHILIDQHRLAGLGMNIETISNTLRTNNLEISGGRLNMPGHQISGRTAGRLTSVTDIAALPIPVDATDGSLTFVRLGEIARVIDTHADEKLRIRLNGEPGVKMSVQKQPQANSVAVADAVNQHLDWLTSEHLIPDDITVRKVGDQSIYVRHSLRNATLAAASGAILAMVVVYLFLGSLRRTLIIGTAIPIAILVTFILMGIAGLKLNIMTLGGLALGVGMLVDSTIVMLENIYRHQQIDNDPVAAAIAAAAEVNSPIIAATSTNIAAIVPFLFIGGLTGLLFRELIFTISASVIAALIVALTLVPALSAKIGATRRETRLRRLVDRLTDRLRDAYARLLHKVISMPWRVIAVFGIALAVSAFLTDLSRQEFLPRMDDGEVRISITADPGISLHEMDHIVQRLEGLLDDDSAVVSVYAQIGGFVFGRSEYEASNRSSLSIQLTPRSHRAFSTSDWIGRFEARVEKAGIAGAKIRMRVRGIRGIRTNRGDDSLSLRIQGPDLQILEGLGDDLVDKLNSVAGLRNIKHSLEEPRQEFSLVIDRDRVAALGLSVENIGQTLQLALNGIVVTDYLEDDRKYDVRIRLDPDTITSPSDIEHLLINTQAPDQSQIYVSDVATVELIRSPARIMRDRQRRIIEISASTDDTISLGEIMTSVRSVLKSFDVPTGYTLYDGGTERNLAEARRLGRAMFALAVFMVFVVMAVQYESVRNPLVIMVSVLFALIGVTIGIAIHGLTISMPLQLGVIMLAGIVVNNAIVLVETIEIQRKSGATIDAAIIEAGRQRLRPILMTTLTTVIGIMPLALGLGDGAEMLQPLAQTIVYGLSFSLLVSLIVIPSVYRLAWAEH